LVAKGALYECRCHEGGDHVFCNSHAGREQDGSREADGVRSMTGTREQQASSKDEMELRPKRMEINMRKSGTELV
jgi:hypothetical protein